MSALEIQASIQHIDGNTPHIARYLNADAPDPLQPPQPADPDPAKPPRLAVLHNVSTQNSPGPTTTNNITPTPTTRRPQTQAQRLPRKEYRELQRAAERVSSILLSNPPPQPQAQRTETVSPIVLLNSTF